MVKSSKYVVHKLPGISNEFLVIVPTYRMGEELPIAIVGIKPALHFNGEHLVQELV